MYQKLVGKVENAQQIELFEQGRSEKVSFWQDREPSPSDLYIPFQTQTQIEFGIFNQRLLATGRYVPMKVRWPQKALAHLVTDFFVRPDARRGLVAGRLFHLMLETAVEIGRDAIYFGIENSPGFMDSAENLAKRYDIEFSFIGTTRLCQLFMTDRPQLDAAAGEKILLKDCSESFWCEFLESYKQSCENLILSPVFEPKLKEDILQIDANAEIYFSKYEKNIQAGFILLDMKAVRRFRWNSEKSLIRLKLDRYRKSKGLTEIKDNDCFLNKILSLSWHSGGKSEAFKSLFFKAVQDTDQLGYDAILFRDLEVHREDFKNLDMLSFDRRVFIFNNSAKENNLAKVLSRNPKIRLEMLTL